MAKGKPAGGAEGQAEDEKDDDDHEVVGEEVEEAQEAEVEDEEEQHGANASVVRRRHGGADRRTSGRTALTRPANLTTSMGVAGLEVVQRTVVVPKKKIYVCRIFELFSFSPAAAAATATATMTAVLNPRRVGAADDGTRIRTVLLLMLSSSAWSWSWLSQQRPTVSTNATCQTYTTNRRVDDCSLVGGSGRWRCVGWLGCTCARAGARARCWLVGCPLSACRVQQHPQNNQQLDLTLVWFTPSPRTPCRIKHSNLM